jgi:TolB-like protein
LSQPLSLPNKPSIAVLPFQNMSGDLEQEYFADGIVEDIITALSRFKSLFVIARNSSFTFKGKAADIKQVGRELGVRYVLEGSVRKAGSRVRITGQLIEAATGGHLWADKFDGALEDVFGLQDQITTSVVGLLAPTIEQAEIDRARQKPTGRLGSYDFYLRGMALANKGGSLPEAREFFRQAFEQDPEYGAAYAMAAWTLVRQQAISGIPLTAEARADAIRLANWHQGSEATMLLHWPDAAISWPTLGTNMIAERRWSSRRSLSTQISRSRGRPGDGSHLCAANQNARLKASTE